MIQRIEVSSVGPYTESRLEPSDPTDLEPINQAEPCDDFPEGYEADLDKWVGVFLFGPDGERTPGVDPGDCDWLYTDQDFEF